MKSIKKVQFLWIIIVAVCLVSSGRVAAFDFTDIRPPDSTISANFENSSIAWRPQGDYAILVSTRTYVPNDMVGIHRYDYATGTLTYQAFTVGQHYFRRVEFSADGSYALITGDTHIYRYDHNASCIGSVTEITDIENPGGCTISYYDVLRHPTLPSEPLYILANLACGSENRVKILRYTPMSTPQITVDESGGISPMDTSAFEPWTGAWQADGDYLVWGNRTANGWHGGIFLWDPDHSTFPPQTPTNEMQFFGSGGLTNISTVCMSPVSGSRFVLVKGTGRVVRFTEYPTVMIADYPWPDYYQTISTGDSGYNAAGDMCIFLERQAFYPHAVMVFDANGDGVTIDEELSTPGFTNYGVRIRAMEWHPSVNMGLMAGEDRWIFRFDDGTVPTPATPTPGITPTPSVTPGQPVPATGPGATILLVLAIGVILLIQSKHYGAASPQNHRPGH